MRFKSGLDYFRPQSRPERIVFKRQTEPGSTIDEKGNKVLKQKCILNKFAPVFRFEGRPSSGAKIEKNIYININSYRKFKIKTIDDE